MRGTDSAALFVLFVQTTSCSTIYTGTFPSIMWTETSWSADSARIFLRAVDTFHLHPLLFEDHIDDNALVCVIHSVIIVSNVIKHAI